jgi:cytochrome P450
VRRVGQSPTDPDFVQDPYRFYDRARDAGQLVRWDDYDMPVATTFAAVDRLLRHRNLGRAHPAPPPVPEHLQAFQAIEDHSMLELEPPRHTRLRRLVLGAFTSRRIAGLAPAIETTCEELIGRFPDGAFDLLETYARPLPVIVIARLIGVPAADADRLLAWSGAMVAMYQARRNRAIEEAANAAATAFSDYLRAHIAARRRAPADDLLSALAAEAGGERLSEDELLATVVLLLNAGHEATVHTLGNAVRAVLLHGLEAAAVETTEAVVEEVLRWDPPLHLFTRHVYAPLEVDGHALHPGDRVGCLLAAAGRDPSVRADPHRFDPARPAPHLAFGAGIHFCVGAPLARAELAIALRTLFRRRPMLALAGTPRYADLYHFHGLSRLDVTA